MPSVYYPGLKGLKAGEICTLEGDELHHLAQVAHRRLKDELILNSSAGLLAKAVVENLNKHSAQLRILHLWEAQPFEHPFAIAFALLKNRNDEIIVEKCTELGAGAFFPLITVNSVRQTKSSTILRFEKIAIAAIKQCDNPWLPCIHTPQSLSSGLEEIKRQGYTPIVCSESRPRHWLHHLKTDATFKPCFVIGPEGGWSPDEKDQFKGLAEISIAGLVTRAETAAIAISAQWLAYANQFSTRGTT